MYMVAFCSAFGCSRWAASGRGSTLLVFSWTSGRMSSACCCRFWVLWVGVAGLCYAVKGGRLLAYERVLRLRRDFCFAVWDYGDGRAVLRITVCINSGFALNWRTVAGMYTCGIAWRTLSTVCLQYKFERMYRACMSMTAMHVRRLGITAR